MRLGLFTLLVGAFSLPQGTCGERRALQVPLKQGLEQDAFSVYDDGLFTPLGDLSALSSSQFTRLSHPAFPRHSVRAKQSQFCDGKVRAYTGYIDVEAHHLFWFFFESRRDPDADDVIFWTNGGPGGSGAVGLFSELGPCRVTSANSTEWNPWSWNEHANIFFIEQPVSVGFSYAEFGESVSTTREAADDVAALMGIFFEHFTKFKGRALHLAGESYGGRYIPVFASAIYDKNAELVQAGLTPVNLTSIMLGNGCTDFSTMFPSYYDAQCADPTFPAIQDISTCVRLKQMVPRCEQRFKKSCVDILDKVDCAAAAAFCFEVLTGHYKNPYFYDRSRSCTHEEEMEVCYPIINDINAYLSQPHIQELLGVDPAVRGNYSLTSATVAAAFDASLDWYSFPAQYHVAALLERGVRALVFVGATDFICNWIGNERMTLGLEWTQQEAYRNEPLRDWLVDGKPAGLTRSGGGLTFATISGAGHLVSSSDSVST
ncbi:Carboxypeptidase Y -like protein [Trametes pubescens]|uniref:Carboxypeptidase n=1 Tax=Trametes pubescens TaxID=154538 RepID=A0A1M2V6E4_TRAPU|nr:Carboxypeptidase Y -like protein [Trametes pubescens]